MSLLILWPLGAGVKHGETLFEGLPVATADDIEQLLGEARRQHPDAFLLETLIAPPGKRSLPGELARAVEAWNAMPKSVTVPRLRGNLARLVGPYRKWKAEAAGREYLLEQLVADVAAAPFTWTWIRFPWLFGKKNGELNSEKLHSEVARGGWKSAANGNGEMTEAEFAKIALRVAKWKSIAGPLFVGITDSPECEDSFRCEVGISSAKFEELQRRFDRGAEG